VVYDWKMELYWRLPVPLQELGLSAYGWHLDRLYYGREFEEFSRFLDDADGWSAEKFAAWQSERLRDILQTAVSRVPYYREAYRGLDVTAVRGAADLPRLPLLLRQRLRQREREFLDERLDPRGLHRAKTSGTTGTSLTLYWRKRDLRRVKAALERRVHEAAGVSRRIPRAMMGGRPILPGRQDKPPYWRRNRYWQQLYLSSYHVSRRTAPAYAAAIRTSGVSWLTGYGSAIAALADNATDAGERPVPLQAVIVSGDTLQPGMRTSIERFFQCRCYDMWGQAEGVGAAMECSAGRMHVVPEVGVLEILWPDGSLCAPGETGEIFATGLLNTGMPLIRYQTGDFAAWAHEAPCPCGSRSPVFESLEGRVDDYLVTSDGRQIGRLSTAIKRSPSIHSAQIVQDRPGHAWLLIRPGEGYRSDDARPVVADILERIGDFGFEVVEVEEIPKTPTGKTKLVVRLSERLEMRETYRELLGRVGIRLGEA
jgi:phenylacetate-CoA ligase